MNRFVATIIAIVCIILIYILHVNVVFAGEFNVRGGMTTDLAPGHEMPRGAEIYKLDFGYQESNFPFYMGLYEGFYWDWEIYLTALYDSGPDDFTGGPGFRLRAGYAFTEDLKLFAGGGFATLVDGGDVSNLAHSWVYGTMEAGVEYKNLVVGIDHMSSAFHGGDDGDVGVNLIFVGWKF